MKYIYGEVDSVHLDVYLTVYRNNSSYGTVTGSGTYDHLAEATITATLKENCYFIGWSDCDSKELTRTITLTSDSTITANFAKKPYLTVKSNNTSYGTVTGSGYYMPGDEVTITATLKENCYFIGWSDCDSKELTRAITLTSDSTITANFAKKPYLTAQPSNSSYGTVTGSGYYMPGDEVTITATPITGLEFAKWNDGNTDNPRIITMGTTDITCTASFTILPMEITGTENGYDYVDLGLPSGLKWATCNVGATTPEGYGNYYAWGETTTKSSYAESNYTYSNSPTTLPLNKDAASVNMGGSWRMPTKAELDELLTECTWIWGTYSGKKGRFVVGKNGNSIFLPAAGYRGSSVLYNAGSGGRYWSSSLDAGNSDGAYGFSFNSDDVYWFSDRRAYGRSVRGVCP